MGGRAWNLVDVVNARTKVFEPVFLSLTMCIFKSGPSALAKGGIYAPCYHSYYSVTYSIYLQCLACNANLDEGRAVEARNVATSSKKRQYYGTHPTFGGSWRPGRPSNLVLPSTRTYVPGIVTDVN